VPRLIFFFLLPRALHPVPGILTRPQTENNGPWVFPLFPGKKTSKMKTPLRGKEIFFKKEKKKKPPSGNFRIFPRFFKNFGVGGIHKKAPHTKNPQKKKKKKFKKKKILWVSQVFSANKKNPTQGVFGLTGPLGKKPWGIKKLKSTFFCFWNGLKYHKAGGRMPFFLFHWPQEKPKGPKWKKARTKVLGGVKKKKKRPGRFKIKIKQRPKKF